MCRTNIVLRCKFCMVVSPLFLYLKTGKFDMTKICFFVVPRKAALYIELTFFDNMAHPSGTLFVPFPLQNSKSLILRHAARVGNNRHRVFVLLCTRCLKPCLRGVRL